MGNIIYSIHGIYVIRDHPSTLKLFPVGGGNDRLREPRRTSLGHRRAWHTCLAEAPVENAKKSKHIYFDAHMPAVISPQPPLPILSKIRSLVCASSSFWAALGLDFNGIGCLHVSIAVVCYMNAREGNVPNTPLRTDQATTTTQGSMLI